MQLYKEIRFYVCLLMGFFLLCWGFRTPPPGEISKSDLIAAGVIFCIGALSVGIDLKGCIAEIRKCIEAAHNTIKETKPTNQPQQ